MSGQKLRIKMIEKAANSTPRPLEASEKTLLNFVSTYITETRSRELLHAILIDCAFRIFFNAAVARFPDEKSLKSDAIKSFIKNNTFVSDSDVDRIQQLLKSALTFRYSPRPKSEKKKRVRENSSGNCYLCGSRVHAGDEIEVDHVWPHSVGGQNTDENLRVAHAECAAIKADSATLADVLLGKSSYITPPNGLKFSAHQLTLWPHKISDKDGFNSYRSDVVSSNMRLAVFMKQEFKCASCSVEFSEAGEARMLNAADSPEWSVFNLSAYCEPCFKKVNS